MINIREVTKLKPTGRRIVDEPRAMVVAFAETRVGTGHAPWSEVHELKLTVGANQAVIDDVPEAYIEQELQRQLHYYLYGELERALPEIINKVMRLPDSAEVCEMLKDLHRKVSF